ncbi:MAG: putative O-glycosylation ligase, exosortase A system-associated [Sphingomonadales bacterium CG12_big_fil_rev_8_21_14_0_65_65_10]|uniref:O-glycosylation ligase, exosortase A system-associated n=1 Tax=Blastomonas marina TaxID=1867408 RepID=A0ABQ1F1B8_9SPHN|nr:putative O-glycosylation ligase, exosortase A system-associated [Blastomonas marina]PIW56487.1 MAG: putative O-glycosylation ligase, exosortase A system-associated [Sphingomonadales bacterium CG12_big_fil_rev_8_21_14_0_65_65_10]GFZ96702.1 hypothetical protein GCM10010923_00660 [Blastomonas marina]
MLSSLFLTAFLLIVFALGLRRPFLWVLVYLYIDIVAPQKIAWSILPSIPVSLIAFVLAFGGWLAFDDKRDSRFGLRQFLMVVLLGYCGMTTILAEFPDSAWDKWAWVWKALLFATFLPLTMRTRLRIEAVVLFLVLSVSVIVINGGVKTVLGGGGYGVLHLLVDDNTGLYEGSIISAVAVSMIPLVLWLAKHGTIFPSDWRVKLFAAGLVFSCLLIPIGTSARTGLVCMAVLGLIVLLQMQRRVLYAAMMGLGLLIALPFLPSSFTDRMGTIQNYQSDQSASTRIMVWKWTVDYVIENPMGGGFDAYRGNSFTYDTREVEQSGPSTVVTTTEITEESRAYHSSYFEMLGEQGWFGLFIWLLLQALGIIHMQRLRREWRRAHEEGAPHGWISPLAFALQQTQIVFLAGAAFVGIAYQPFILIVIGIQCALWSYAKRIRGEAVPVRTALRPSQQQGLGAAPGAFTSA